jgi:hypothetical protein
MADPEARLAARLEFGSLEMTKEQCRDMRRVNFAGDLVKDLAYSFCGSEQQKAEAALSRFGSRGARAELWAAIGAYR